MCSPKFIKCIQTYDLMNFTMLWLPWLLTLWNLQHPFLLPLHKGTSIFVLNFFSSYSTSMIRGKLILAPGVLKGLIPVTPLTS